MRRHITADVSFVTPITCKEFISFFLKNFVSFIKFFKCFIQPTNYYKDSTNKNYYICYRLKHVFISLPKILLQQTLKQILQLPLTLSLLLPQLLCLRYYTRKLLLEVKRRKDEINIF